VDPDVPTPAPPPEGYTWWHNDEAGRWELGQGVPGLLWTAATVLLDEWLAEAPETVAELWAGRVVDSVEGRGLTLTCEGCGLQTGWWPHLHTNPTPVTPPCPTCGTEFTITPAAVPVSGATGEVAPPAPVGVPAAPPVDPPRRPPWVRGPVSRT